MTTIIVITAILIFSVRTIFFVYGLSRTRNIELEMDKTPDISIIIPARNEENNLEECINSILKSDYPQSKMEIVIVNDRSEDNTKLIAESLAGKFGCIKIVNIYNDLQKGNIKGKAGAIHFGVAASANEIILMTDADCTVEKTWARGIANLFVNENADMVASFSVIKEKNLINKLEELQWLYMNCMASGSSGNNFLLGCYGNNQSFRKSCYESVGGYSKIKFSVTEDLALLQSFSNKNYKILYPCNQKLLVKTKPVGTLKDYFRQLHRWTRGGKGLGYKAVLFVITSFSIWFAALFCAWQGEYLYILLLFLARLILDSWLMIPALNKLGLKKIQKFIIFGVPFLLFLELISPIILLKKKVTWKGQEF